MSQPFSLKEAEQKVFRTVANDGLWDILLGSFFLLFSLAPLLSVHLGDFWSSAVFLPVWGSLYLAIQQIRKRIVQTRVGHVRFGQTRKATLGKLNLIMLVVNTLALVMGIIAAINFPRIPGQLTSILFGLILLLGLSIAARITGLWRLYLYGLLVGFAPLLGEWLYTKGLTTHHGFPLTFGVVAGVMILMGIARFVGILRSYPAQENDIPGVQA